MTIERRICIPDDVSFADLKLQRHTDGAVSFEWGPITRICEASDIDPALFRAGPPDNVSALIAGIRTDLDESEASINQLKHKGQGRVAA